MKKIIIIGLCLVIAIVAVILVMNSIVTPNTQSLTISEIYNKIANTVALPKDMVSRNAEDLEMRYGIDVTKVQDYIFMANATSYYVDTIAIFKVENVDDRKAIETSLNTIKTQAENSMNNYDAEQYKIATDGVVFIDGQYVVLIMTTDTTTVKNIIKDNI